jgi:O-antigen/teichoic acid export membrane protein
LADEIANIATTEIIAPINRAAYPGYAKLADNILDLKAIYLKTMSFIAIIGLPCSTGVAVVAPLLVPLLLGEQWHDTIPIIQVIALASAADLLNTNASYIYITLKKQYIMTRLLLLKTLLLLPLLLILSEKYGIQGAAFAILLTSTFMLPFNLFKISIVLHINWREYIKCLHRPIIASTMMVGFLSTLIIPTQNQQAIAMLLLLATSILIGIFTFCIALLMLWKLTGNVEDPEYTILTLLQQKLGKF